MNEITETQQNLLSALEQRHWEHNHQDNACKRSCVPVPEQPLLTSSAQSLLTWKPSSDCGQMSPSQADSLGFESAGGSEPRRSPANETVLSLSLYSQSQMTLQCVSFPGTYAFLLFPWRLSLGSHEVTSHQVLASVWALNARSANALSCVVCRICRPGENSSLRGWFCKGRQTFSNLAPH